ncbi:MAG: YihY/virulence factor BrkB family protein [Geminicoccaceae bacterium]
MPDRDHEARPGSGGVRAAKLLSAGALLAVALARGNRQSAEPRDTPKPDAVSDADGPTEIPPHGWWEVLKRVWDEIGRDNMSIIAAGCGFYALLALFPAITALVAIYGIVADPSTIEQQVSGLSAVVPEAAVDLIGTQAHAVAATGATRLTWGAAIALLLALYSATSGMKTLFQALNIAYEEEETRSFVRFNLTAFLFTLVAIVGIAVMIGLIVGMPLLIGLLPFGSLGTWLVRIGSWLLLGVALLYRFGPSRAPARWRWVTPGSLAAVGLWLLGSLAFSLYVGRFAAYNETYGTLGGVVILLMWLYISAFSILLGAELNAELELETARDTTTGAPQPIGRREAYVADHTAQQVR